LTHPRREDVLNRTSLMMNPCIILLNSIQTALVVLLIQFLACTPGKNVTPAGGQVARIISLSPSITREITDLGGGELLVGVTSYDDYHGPGMEIVGTLIQPNIEKIILLKPDLVFYSAEDGLVQNVERLTEAGVATHRFTRNKSYADICKNYLILGGILGRESTARDKIKQYTEILDRIKGSRSPDMETTRPLVAFLVSCRPLIVASADSFIGQVIRDSGGRCPYGGAGRPHPLVSIESLVVTDPDMIISMTGGEDTSDFFHRLEVDFKDMKALRYGNIYTIAPDTIPYYTPADYVKSLERISVMIKKARKSPRFT
jgi:iron complex transport system substrate-binding protein